MSTRLSLSMSTERKRSQIWMYSGELAWEKSETCPVSPKGTGLNSASCRHVALWHCVTALAVSGLRLQCGKQRWWAGWGVEG